MFVFGAIGRSLRGVLNVEAFDADVSFSLLNRLWTACGGLIILVLVGLFTTPIMQGFYYTFNSLVYMQVFIELGLGIALVQLIGHEMARLKHTEGGSIVGDEAAKKRLHSLVRFSGFWFSTGSILLFALLCTFGTAFFLHFGKDQLPPEDLSGVIAAWLLVAFGVSSSLMVNAALFVVEGSGHVASAARIRLLQGVTSISAAAIILACGGGLFAIAAQTVMTPVIGGIALACRHRTMLIDLWTYRSEFAGLDWRKEIWPFQFRIAVSWLSGFFALQVFSPLLFALAGATAAGRVGMSLQIFTALNGLFIVLITARTPMFTRLIALGERDELRQLFGRAFRQSTALLLVALLGLLPVLFVSSWLFPTLLERMVPWPYFLLLGVTSIANHFLFAEAAFLRAHREEPFMLLSSASGILTVISAIGLIAAFGLPGAVFAYSGVTLLFTLPIGTTIFLRYWKDDVF